MCERCLSIDQEDEDESEPSLAPDIQEALTHLRRLIVEIDQMEARNSLTTEEPLPNV